MNRQALLQDVQPLCIKIIQNPSINNINSLHIFIKNIIIKEKEWNETDSVLNDLKEYLVFPLLLQIKSTGVKDKKGKDCVLEEILKCLATVLSQLNVFIWKFFADIFGSLFTIITRNDNPQEVSEVSEEMKILVLQNVTFLCKALPDYLWKDYCSAHFRPQLGHAIYICLRLAEKEKFRDLKIQALTCVEELALKSHHFVIDVEDSHRLSFTCAHFLPGVVQTSTRIATAGEVQGHKITQAAISCWTHFVQVVMRDEFLSLFASDLGASETYTGIHRKLFPPDYSTPNRSKDLYFLYDNSSEQAEDSPRLKQLDIDTTWITLTSQQLSLLLVSITSLVSHSHWKVKMGLIDLSEVIFQHCCRSLGKSLTICLQILITLKSDPVVEVSQAASKTFLDIKGSFIANGGLRANEIFLELMEERIFSLCTSLPTIIKTKDDATLLASLRQLEGAIDLVGVGLCSTLQIPSHLHRLVRALTVLFSPSYSDPDILSERISREDFLDTKQFNFETMESFKYFRSRTIAQVGFSICSSLGFFGDPSFICDHCLDMLQSSTDVRNEVVIVLIHLVRGAARRQDFAHDEKEKMVDSIIDCLINIGAFAEPLNVGNQKTDETVASNDRLSVALLSNFKTSTSVDLAKRNVVFVSNALRLVGSCSLLLGTEFDIFLSRILYHVLEKVGDDNILVSQNALKTLEEISSATNCQSVSEFMEKSIPFFWFPLSQKLKRLPEYPSSPQVLRVAFRFSNRGEFKTFVEELVEDVLISLDTFHSESCYSLLLVILSFIEVMASNHLIKPNQNCPTNDTQDLELKPSNDIYSDVSKSTEDIQHDNSSDHLSVADYILKTYKDHQTRLKELEEAAKLEDADTDDVLSLSEKFQNVLNEEEIEQPVDQSEEKKVIPKYIELTCSILDRCSYLLFVKNRKIQLVILNIVYNCCHVLKDWEDQKLPCYHKIWKPLLRRLKDNDFIVVLKALEVCVLMVNTSGDFLFRRFFKELFPALVSFLQSQSSTSLGKSPKSAYYQTPACKAQKQVLFHIPKMLSSFHIGVVEATALIEVLLLYLDSRQPPILTDLALSCLKCMNEHNPDLVWLKLAFSKGNYKIIPPSELLNPVWIKGNNNTSLIPEVWSLFGTMS